MAIQVVVGGLDVTIRVENNSLQWEDQVDGRGTLRVRFMEELAQTAAAAATGIPSGLLMAITRPSVTYAFATPWRPEDGSEIVVSVDGVRVFGGYLIEPEEEASPGNDLLFYNCNGVEYSSICDRIPVARSYTDKTLREIVLDIVAQDMAEEGIDTSLVEDGPIIKKANFPWVSVTSAFNELAELAGMAWTITPNKVLQFAERASIAAPAPLNNLAVMNGRTRFRTDRQHYRNHQVLRGSVGLSDPRTETFTGDDERRTFNLAYKAGTEPVVTVNGTPKTVGIRQLETGKDWYWNKGANELSQDTGGTVLALGDTLAVTYQGMFPIIVSAQRGEEVEARRAIEGGSGRYSRVEERSNIETVDAALAAAQAILNRYGKISDVLTCLTDQPGYAPGQLVPIDFPQHNATGEYLIESLKAQWVGGQDQIWYTLKCISGDPYGGWQEYFRRLMKVGRQFVINENEVVVGLVELADSAAASDVSLTVSSGSPERRVGFALVGFSAVRAA